MRYYELVWNAENETDALILALLPWFEATLQSPRLDAHSVTMWRLLTSRSIYCCSRPLGKSPIAVTR